MPRRVGAVPPSVLRRESSRTARLGDRGPGSARGPGVAGEGTLADGASIEAVTTLLGESWRVEGRVDSRSVRFTRR
jgi:hypothetical protein